MADPAKKDDIFSDEGNKDLTKDNTSTDNIIPDDKDDKTADQLLAAIVNTDGTQKYKSPEEALIGLAHAQKHIQSLETDNAGLKEKGNASDKLDELLAAVKQSQDSGEDGEKDVSTMNPEDVLGIVKEYFDDTKAAESRTNNINSVINVFKDRYGKEASKELYDKADDLGFSRKEINGMIATNPNAALKVLGVTPKAPPVSDPAMQSNNLAAQFRETQEEKPASVMNISSSKDLTDAWKASQQRTLKRLGIEPDK